jgi:signal transduction histidine kinase
VLDKRRKWNLESSLMQGTVVMKPPDEDGTDETPRSARATKLAEGRHPPSESVSLPTARADLQEKDLRPEQKVHDRTMALATVAHELKTPIAIVSGYIELLLGEKVGQLNHRQRQILKDSLANCARLQKFVQDFLAFSALDTGKIAVRMELGDLNDCLSQLCSYWVDRFTGKGVALYFSSNPKLERFQFDSQKVQQIVSNLLDNALKFTPAGGTVWVTAEPYMWERRVVQSVPLVPERRRQNSSAMNAVKVTVADTGPGVPPEYHQEIFDDFFKVPGEENQTGATGLGLAIVRRLVTAQGGKVWVENDLGQGSKFSFLLPLAAKQDDAALISRRKAR